MGTHISRVKSVDLDAWTDEQLQNMLRWGNTRANKFVMSISAEFRGLTSKGIGRRSLLLGTFLQKRRFDGLHLERRGLHICSKIENFIRTKYDSKRWVMDGGMPDPSTLDTEGDDDVVRHFRSEFYVIPMTDDTFLSPSTLSKKRRNWKDLHHKRQHPRFSRHERVGQQPRLIYSVMIQSQLLHHGRTPPSRHFQELPHQ